MPRTRSPSNILVVAVSWQSAWLGTFGVRAAKDRQVLSWHWWWQCVREFQFLCDLHCCVWNNWKGCEAGRKKCRLYRNQSFVQLGSKLVATKTLRWHPSPSWCIWLVYDGRVTFCLSRMPNKILRVSIFQPRIDDQHQQHLTQRFVSQPFSGAANSKCSRLYLCSSSVNHHDHSMPKFRAKNRHFVVVVVKREWKKVMIMKNCTKDVRTYRPNESILQLGIIPFNLG
jgi:hypothetical protein